MKKLLLLFCVIVLSTQSWADDSGSCGENVTYYYEEATKTLTISGTGAMNDYVKSNGVSLATPWNDYRDDIVAVIINSGVTTIGSSAFWFCRNLETVTIANTIKTIGKRPFGATKIASIFIPESVSNISIEAFRSCELLTQIVVDRDNSVYDSRDNCNAIIETSSNKFYIGCKASTIPSTVYTIGEYAFSGVFIGTVNQTISSYVIPNHVKEIGKGAFYGGTGLKSITIPSSVTSIGEEAFMYCGLTSVILPEGIDVIKKSTFENCGSLASVTIPGSVTTIEERAFKMSGLTSVVIPNSVKTIGRIAFYYSPLINIEIGSGISFIGDNAFNDGPNSNLNSVKAKSQEPLPISSDVFSVRRSNAKLNVPLGSKKKYEVAEYWKDFKEIIEEDIITSGSCGENVTYSYSEANKTLTISGYGAMEDYMYPKVAPWKTFCDKIERVLVESGVTVIGMLSFCDCKNMKSISLPKTIIRINDCAFQDCSSLTSLSLPKSVTTIGDMAFYGCYSLADVISESKIPAEIKENTYPNRFSTTLYVPHGYKDTYSTTGYWKEFMEIVEMGKEAIEKLTISPLSGLAGGYTYMSVNVENEYDVLGFQFDLALPTGVTVALDRGTPIAQMTNRSNGHSIAASQINDNTYRFVVTSMNRALSGNDGAVMNVKLYVQNGITAGDYDITAKNIELTVKDSNTQTAMNPRDVTATLTVLPFMRGDVNGDGRLSVTDVMGIISHILRDTPADFNQRAADMNGDGYISVIDAISVIDMILTLPSQARQREPQYIEPQ